jgi:hypothetical protein
MGFRAFTCEGRLKSSYTHLITPIGTLWTCSYGFFFEVPPLASDALLITLHPFLENVLQTVCRKLQEERRSSLFAVGNAQKSHGWSGLCGGCSNEAPTIYFFQGEHRIQFRSRFRDGETNVKGQNRLFHYPPEAYGKRSAARFREMGRAL